MLGVIVLLLSISFSHADPRGKPYQRDVICQQFNTMGKDKFTSLALIMNSRKYSNATYEEIEHVVKDIASLASTCCANGAAPNCYDNGANAMSAKSCDPKSPFPKHPGTSTCCIYKGLERKLCLADLKQPPKEFPTYVEPSNEELCVSFKKDPQKFSSRFLYEYSSNFAQTPFLVILKSTENYLKMIAQCCTTQRQAPCFLQQRLNMTPLHLLTVMSNRLCSSFNSYGEEKLKFSASIMLSQKVPSAEFKDVMTVVDQCTQVLAKCCNSITDDCIGNELTVHIQQVCKNLQSKDSRVADCCKKTPIETLHCLHSMSTAEPIKLPALQWPKNDDLCKEDKNQEIDKYLFELARRNTKLPEVFISKLHGSVEGIVKGCCNSADSNTCLNNKGPQLKKEINKYITEGNELCGDYNKYVFTEFKERTTKMFSRRFPKLSASKLEELVEKRTSLASTCCVTNAPPVYCSEMISNGFKINCPQQPCLLQ
ncbi:vitamin D-binding protein [Bombina bombina]|uniref:vitamin D-binding protein n=1 Tax=Bombina bombina TaxID=8345 RepID=UPI00235A89CB|nr:vitamin D-binding protein [Bombina bombina]